jgi:hypothetical protein
MDLCKNIERHMDESLRQLEGLDSFTAKDPHMDIDQTFFPAEGYGLLSVIWVIHISKKKWRWTNQYTIICDNQAMIEIMQEKVQGR